MDAPWIPSGFICYIRSISFITYIRLIYVVLPFPTSWIPSASICYTISISTTSICSICFPVPWISTDSIYFYDFLRSYLTSVQSVSFFLSFHSLLHGFHQTPSITQTRANQLFMKYIEIPWNIFGDTFTRVVQIISRFLNEANASSMPHLPRNLILMILLLCRAILSWWEMR